VSTTSPPPPARPKPRGRRLPVVLAIAAVIVVAVVVTAVVVWTSAGTADGRTPHPGMALAVVADTQAGEAASSAPDGSVEQEAAAYLAAMPTAAWLNPEEYGVTAVKARVDELAAEARAQSAALTIVVYGLPGRDCGEYSAGGLPPEEYRAWTHQIGLGLEAASDLPAIVVLEPDSLAQAPQCGNVSDRVTQLRGAVDELSGSGASIYLDAGHSNWLPADEMAGLLRQAGVERVRGFATNVSNYNLLSDEVAYAHRLSELLDGAHAVIDTSRSGAGSDGEWCNPPERRVGDAGGSTGDDVVDVNLWIKAPGESDGECNGGPAAGAWWPEAAVELTRDAVR
jgi:endoglucanase